MERLSSFLLCATVLSAGVVSADVRPLSEAERQALVGVARTADVVDAYAETEDGKTLLRYATVIYRGEPLADGGCIATTVEYMAPPGAEPHWEPVFNSVGYRFWPGVNECGAVSA